MTTVQELAGCIDYERGSRADLILAEETEHGPMLRFDGRPNVYRGEATALMEHGYAIGGMVDGAGTNGQDHPDASDDDVCLFLRPLVKTTETRSVEATETTVDFE